MATIHTGIVAFNLGYEFDFTLVLLAGIAVLYYFTGILLARVESN